MARPAKAGCYMRTPAFPDDDVFNPRAASRRYFQGLLGNRRQRDVLTFAVCEVCREQRLRSTGGNAVAKRVRAETGEHDRMDGADADRREHQHHGFCGHRHVDRDAIALVDAKAAERRRDALYFVQDLRVGIDRTLATFVEVDQRGMAAASVRDVVVERVVAEIRFAADEPSEGRRRPLERLVPGPEPRQLAGCAIPETLRIAARVVEPALHDRRDETSGAHKGQSICWNGGIVDSAWPSKLRARHAGNLTRPLP